MSITHEARIAHLKQQLALAEEAKAADQQSQNSAPAQAGVLSFCEDDLGCDGLDLGSLIELGGTEKVQAEKVQEPVSASPMSSVVSSVVSSVTKSGASSKKKAGNAAYKEVYRKDWWQVESRASDLLTQVIFNLLNRLS